jgi:uncharacterized YccA/Bax inhibitor family protein
VIVYPVWVSLILTIVNAVIAYLQVQETVVLDPMQTLVVNIVAVVVTAVLAFQKQATSAVRSMRSR